MANSKRRCRQCKEYGRADEMVITPSNAAFCDDKCAAIYARKKIPQTRAKLEQEQRRDFRKDRKEYLDNDKGHQEHLTQQQCNKLAVLLDQGEVCISCGEPAKLEAGHFRSVGSCTELRFDLLNIYGQCRACNQAGTRRMNRGRNPQVVAKEYERRLRERMGDGVVDWLQGPHPIPHRTVEQLKILRAMFAAEIKYIKDHGKPSRNWRAFPPKEAAA